MVRVLRYTNQNRWETGETAKKIRQLIIRRKSRNFLEVSTLTKKVQNNSSFDELVIMNIKHVWLQLKSPPSHDSLLIPLFYGNHVAWMRKKLKLFVWALSWKSLLRKYRERILILKNIYGRFFLLTIKKKGNNGETSLHKRIFDIPEVKKTKKISNEMILHRLIDAEIHDTFATT